MYQSIKVIFIDIDWTLLDHTDVKKQFDIKSIEALKEAQNKGVKVFYCTARPYHSVDQIGGFKLLNPDGYICCNGSLVVVDNKIIYQNSFTHECSNKVCEITLSHGLTTECVQAFDRFLTAESNIFVDYVYQSFYEETPPVCDYYNKDIISMLLFAPRELDEVLKKELPQNINYYRFHDYGVELLYQPKSKGDGVKVVLDYLGIPKEESISFGDDFGDIAMFEATGIGVAMGNGKPEVKEKADYITEEVWNSGVYHALKHFKII